MIEVVKGEMGEMKEAIERMEKENKSFRKMLVEKLLGYAYVSGRYVKYFAEKRTWSHASIGCRDDGGELISVDDDSTNEWVANIPQKQIWIGATDQGHEGEWTWPDGRKVPDRYWQKAAKEPNGGTSENCAMVFARGYENDKNMFGFWNDWSLLADTKMTKTCSAFGMIGLATTRPRRSPANIPTCEFEMREFKSLITSVRPSVLSIGGLFFWSLRRYKLRSIKIN